VLFFLVKGRLELIKDFYFIDYHLYLERILLFLEKKHMTTINPYLSFSGNCKEAFDFYQSIFGGDFTFVGTFSDMPDNPEMPPMSDDAKSKIMHISLPIGNGSVLMGSDSLPGFGPELIFGSNFSVSINTSSKEETERLFSGLSNGGQIKMPLNETFWGAYFGMFVDKFGVHWMVNCELQPKK